MNKVLNSYSSGCFPQELGNEGLPALSNDPHVVGLKVERPSLPMGIITYLEIQGPLILEATKYGMITTRAGEPGCSLSTFDLLANKTTLNTKP